MYEREEGITEIFHIYRFHVSEDKHWDSNETRTR